MTTAENSVEHWAKVFAQSHEHGVTHEHGVRSRIENIANKPDTFLPMMQVNDKRIA